MLGLQHLHVDQRPCLPWRRDNNLVFDLIPLVEALLTQNRLDADVRLLMVVTAAACPEVREGVRAEGWGAEWHTALRFWREWSRVGPAASRLRFTQARCCASCCAGVY